MFDLIESSGYQSSIKELEIKIVQYELNNLFINSKALFKQIQKFPNSYQDNELNKEVENY